MKSSTNYRRRPRMPFYYEPEIAPDYTEDGAENGAKLETSELDNSDILRIYNATKTLNLEESLAWLDAHEAEFDNSTVITDTDEGHSLSQYRERNPKVFISKHPLNQVRHLNTLLNRANEELAPGGYFWAHCRTAVLKKQLMLQRYPKGLNWIIYLLHYLWHRVMAKLPMTKPLYFGITKGKNRTFNRVEVLGRMYRAGFEVIDEGFRFGEFLVLARKIKEPIWHDKPTGSPLIKLKRVGKDGKLIGVYKFRTMYSYSEYLQPYVYKYNNLQEGGKFSNDYRINVWGKFFRKIWIDELPMFINLFKGDIKLVGVRPLSLQFFSLYTPEMQQLRIKVKPGLLPPSIAEKEMLKTLNDIQYSERIYIENYNKHPFLTDCKYLLLIIFNIFFKSRRSS